MTMRSTLPALALALLTPLLDAGAQRPSAPAAPDAASLAAPLRALVEKLGAPTMAQQIEGAYGLGQMGASAAPAIPFLLLALRRDVGMVDVDTALLKYFEPGTSYLAGRGVVMMINPAQDVASASLAKIGRPAIAPLSRALQGADPSELFFGYLTDALARVPDPAATAVLLDLLRGANRSARFRVASSLRWNRDPATLDPLIDVLGDSAASVRRTAARALERRTGQSLGEDAARWRAWRAGQPAPPPK
jgi:hypothetical protein